MKPSERTVYNPARETATTMVFAPLLAADSTCPQSHHRSTNFATTMRLGSFPERDKWLCLANATAQHLSLV